MIVKSSERRWVYLILGTICLFFSGIIYAWSILKAPLASEFGWTASALSLNFTLTMCFFCIGGMLGGLLIRKLGSRVTLIISAVLSFAGFVMASRISDNILVLYISYGLICGLGIGISYNCVLSTVSAWFPDKKGLCSGILMMGFGASSLVLGSLADSLIANPNYGWRLAYQLLGISLGLVLAVSAFILKAPGSNPKEERKDRETGGRDYTTGEMLHTLKFWKVFVCVIFLAAVGNTVISMAKDLAMSVGTAASTATILVGALSVFNGLSRVVTGAVFDRYGRRFTMIAANLCTICSALLTLFSIISKSPLLCVMGLCLTGFSYGTCPTISSAYISEIFGTKYYSLNFPIMNCNLIFASFIATGANLLVGESGRYDLPFVMLLALTAVALLLNLSVNAKKE